MEKGIIFDRKEFAVFDGPGIRQTVFLKGCPLRCSWCHNPEGLCMQPQLMVSHASCTHCGRCAAVCTHEKCVACGACVPVCPLGLRKIAGEFLTSGELARRILADAGYYSRYGGITFSGGEPLMQADFLAEVLEMLPGLHKAVETSGYCEPDVFRRIVGLLDYVIMDIKLFDGEKHRRYTGADNRRILENAEYLCGGRKPFLIRIPVIPGVNDDEENFRSTAAFLAGAEALERVEFLPYHQTAGAKYGMLGLEYRPDFDADAGIRICRSVFSEYGIPTEVL